MFDTVDQVPEWYNGSMTTDAKSEAIRVRVDGGLLYALDKFCEVSRMSRSEAIRRGIIRIVQELNAIEEAEVVDENSESTS